jgi:hypothetical protein
MLDVTMWRKKHWCFAVIQKAHPTRIRAEVKLLPKLTRVYFGERFGDTGYLSQPVFEPRLEPRVGLMALRDKLFEGR